MIDQDQFGGKKENGCEKPAISRAASLGAEDDARIRQALQDFRASVRAWSDAAYSQPREVRLVARHWNWRLATGWALGCLLVAGTLTGGLLEYRHRQNEAQIAAQQIQEQELAAAREKVRQEDRKLMTTVDNEISQQVPSAMEPLAQLMQVGDGETQ